MTEDQADDIIELIEAVDKEVDFANVEHMADLSAKDREFCLEKFDAACKIANVSYTLTDAENSAVKGDVVCTFFYNNKEIGTIDTHVVKKTGRADYPSLTVLVLGTAVMALAAVAFVGTKKYALSK